jgi:hypothetical protein
MSDNKTDTSDFVNVYSLQYNETNPIDQIDKVLTDEEKRLIEKKQQIDKALFNQERIQTFNDSYSKKYAYYNNILIYILFILFIYLAIVLVKRFFPIIPSFILDIITILLFAFAIIYVSMKLSDINSRDKIYFDKLNYENGSILSKEELNKISKQSAESGDLSGYFNANIQNKCIGQACCSTGTTWCESANRCVTGNCCTTGNCEGFSNMDFSFIVSNGSNESVKSYEPSEFDKYHKI